MILKTKLQQLPLWAPTQASEGVELTATRRRELTAALADLLWEFASLAAETESQPEHGGEYAERNQDPA